jgi:hypothetical protein
MYALYFSKLRESAWKKNLQKAFGRIPEISTFAIHFCGKMRLVCVVFCRNGAVAQLVEH